MNIHHARFLAVIAPEPPLSAYAVEPRPESAFEPDGPPAPRRAQTLSCGGCGFKVPQIGSTVRRVDGMRRRVGVCCAQPIGAMA